MVVDRSRVVRVSDGLKLCHIWGDPSWGDRVVLAPKSFLECELPEYGRPWLAGLVMDDVNCDAEKQEKLAAWNIPVAGLDSGALSPTAVAGDGWCTSPWKIYGGGPRIVLYDLGIKSTLLRELSRPDITLTVVPPKFEASELEDLRPEAIVFAGGPWRLDEFTEPMKAARAFRGKRPLLGLGSGMLLLAMALGVEVKKMDTGHWGFTEVTDLHDGVRFGTLQAHGHCVEVENLRGSGAVPEIVNAEDGTVECFKHYSLKVFAASFPGAFSEGEEGTELLDEMLSFE